MSLSKYQIFLRTVECGSFTKAAESMSFTQSGVSHAVQSLEDELGVCLLGPIPAPLAMLRGRRRFSCLIKSAGWQEVRVLYHEALRQQCASRLRLFLDLDPVNML